MISTRVGFALVGKGMAMGQDVGGLSHTPICSGVIVSDRGSRSAAGTGCSGSHAMIGGIGGIVFVELAVLAANCPVVSNAETGAGEMAGTMMMGAGASTPA